jgi:hypothetical protein
MTLQEEFPLEEKIKAFGKLYFYSEIFVGLVAIRHKNCFFACLNSRSPKSNLRPSDAKQAKQGESEKNKIMRKENAKP